MVAFADDYVEMGLVRLSSVADPLFEDFFGFFDELAMEIDCIAGDFPYGVVFAKDEFGGLFVVFICFGCVLFGLCRGIVGARSITPFVGLTRFSGVVLVLTLFFAGEVAETVVFLFGIGGGTVIEG